MNWNAVSVFYYKSRAVIKDMPRLNFSTDTADTNGRILVKPVEERT